MSVFKNFLGNHAIKNALIGSFEIPNTRSFKSALKIKWVRPIKKPLIHPAMSGDRASILKYMPKTLVLDFEKSKELERFVYNLNEFVVNF